LEFKDLFLKRVFIEGRYKDAIMLYDNKAKIVKDNQEYLPQFKIDKEQEAVVMKHIEKQMSVSVFLNRFVIDMEDVTNFSYFRDVSVNIIKNLCASLDIETFNRLGIRYNYGLSLNKIEEADDFIKRTFFKINNDQWNVLSGNPLSFNIKFSYATEKYKINFSIYPAVVQTVIINNNTTEKNERNFYCILDVDVYRQNMSVKDVKELIIDSNKIIKSEIMNFMNEVETKEGE